MSTVNAEQTADNERTRVRWSERRRNRPDRRASHPPDRRADHTPERRRPSLVDRRRGHSTAHRTTKPSEWLGVKPTVWIYRNHNQVGYLIAVGRSPRGYTAWALTRWGARYAANRYRTGRRSALNARRSSLR